MRIVIEGFDGTGKSTLCDHLKSAIGCEVFRASPAPPVSLGQLFHRARVAVDLSIEREAIVFDRWPLISDHIYGSPGSIVRIDASLRLARIDRIVHCDVDDPSQLRIEPRDGDAADLKQTLEILPLAKQKLEAYRELMNDLKFLGHDVRRYIMRTK